MRRRLLPLVFLLASLHAAPASATALVGPDGSPAPQRYQAWLAGAQVPTPAGLMHTLLYTAVFAGSFLYLGFWVYAWDRAAGRVKRRIGLYEWFLRGK